MSDTNYIIGDTPEDLNRKHNVTLTEGQISTILFVLEGYINPSEILAYDPECREEILLQTLPYYSQLLNI